MMRVCVAALLVTSAVGYGGGGGGGQARNVGGCSPGSWGCAGGVPAPGFGGNKNPIIGNKKVVSAGGSGGYWWQSNNPFVGAGSRAPSVGGQASGGGSVATGSFGSRPISGSVGGRPTSGTKFPGSFPGVSQGPVSNDIVGPMGICPPDFVCVHWQLCRGGQVIIDGTGIIDKTKRKPFGQDNLQSCGGDMVCCGVTPGYTVPGVISTLTSQQFGSSESNVDIDLHSNQGSLAVNTASAVAPDFLRSGDSGVSHLNAEKPASGVVASPADHGSLSTQEFSSPSKSSNAPSPSAVSAAENIVAPQGSYSLNSDAHSSLSNQRQNHQNFETLNKGNGFLASSGVSSSVSDSNLAHTGQDLNLPSNQGSNNPSLNAFPSSHSAINKQVPSHNADHSSVINLSSFSNTGSFLSNTGGHVASASFDSKSTSAPDAHSSISSFSSSTSHSSTHAESVYDQSSKSNFDISQPGISLHPTKSDETHHEAGLDNFEVDTFGTDLSSSAIASQKFEGNLQVPLNPVSPIHSSTVEGDHISFDSKISNSKTRFQSKPIQSSLSTHASSSDLGASLHHSLPQGINEYLPPYEQTHTLTSDTNTHASSTDITDHYKNEATRGDFPTTFPEPISSSHDEKLKSHENGQSHSGSSSTSLVDTSRPFETTGVKLDATVDYNSPLSSNAETHSVSTDIHGQSGSSIHDKDKAAHHGSVGLTKPLLVGDSSHDVSNIVPGVDSKPSTLFETNTASSSFQSQYSGTVEQNNSAYSNQDNFEHTALGTPLPSGITHDQLSGSNNVLTSTNAVTPSHTNTNVPGNIPVLEGGYLPPVRDQPTQLNKPSKPNLLDQDALIGSLNEVFHPGAGNRPHSGASSQSSTHTHSTSTLNSQFGETSAVKESRPIIFNEDVSPSGGAFGSVGSQSRPVDSVGSHSTSSSGHFANNLGLGVGNQKVDSQVGGGYSQTGTAGKPGSVFDSSIQGGISSSGSFGSLSSPGTSLLRPGKPSPSGSFGIPSSAGGFQSSGTTGGSYSPSGSHGSQGFSGGKGSSGSFVSPNNFGSPTSSGNIGPSVTQGSSGTHQSSLGSSGSFGPTGSTGGGYSQPGSQSSPGLSGSFGSSLSSGSNRFSGGSHAQKGSSVSSGSSLPGGSYSQPGSLGTPGFSGSPVSGGSFPSSPGSSGSNGNYGYPSSSGSPGSPASPGSFGGAGSSGSFAQQGSSGFPGRVPSGGSGSYNQPSGGQLTAAGSALNPSMAGMMAGMMGMGGTPLLAGSCSAGTFCVPRFQCNPFNGFIIMDPAQLQAVWPDAPQVPLLDCIIPAGVLDGGVCCQQMHPIIGPNGQVLD